MGLRKGNVAVDNNAAAQETPPPFDAGAVVTPEPAPVEPAPQPAVVATQTAAPDQQAAANVAAAQSAPAPAPVQSASPAPTQMPAVTSQGGGEIASSSAIQQLENSGFGGLEFGFGSFPMITLQNDGTFQSSEGGSLGTSFEVILLGSVSKWIYKNDQKGPAEDFFYTFDQITSTGGEPIADILAGWDARGWKYEVKKYLDVQAQLVSNDEDNGTLVLLSIPPTSVSKFSGYVATVQGRHQRNPNAVVTKIELGEKVTKVKHPFHPWSFSFHSDVQ